MWVLHRLAARERPVAPWVRRERPARTAGAVEALCTAGLLSEEEAVRWRSWAANGLGAPVVLDESLAPRASELLEAMMSAAGSAHDGALATNRIWGALEALSAVGVADESEWDRRWRELTGLPSEEEERKQLRQLNAGGTEQDLLAVILGPGERAGGFRLLYVLLFSDGVTLKFMRDAASDELVFSQMSAIFELIELRDNLATDYRGGGFSSTDGEYTSAYRTPAPSGAKWLEVVFPAGKVLRVTL